MSEPRHYLPSNGSEGDGFMEAFCNRCRRETWNPETDKGRRCSILTAAYFGNPGPKEWIYGEDGRPTCTAFEDRAEYRKKHPPKPDPRQATLPIGGADE